MVLNLQLRGLRFVEVFGATVDTGTVDRSRDILRHLVLTYVQPRLV